jgi:uncharacterized membrane protein YbaN (DUF454 family)
MTIKRFIYIALGWIFVCIAVLGIFLPLLPTTPFLLLASSCFMKGSTRFYHWLTSHPTFGPIILDWNQHHAVSKRVKLKAVILIIFSFSLSIWFVPLLWQKALLFLFASMLLFWFIRLPSRKEVDLNLIQTVAEKE